MKKIKLSKKSQVRKRFVRNLLSSLILFEQVTTTQTRAKALKNEANSFIATLKSSKDEVTLKRLIKSKLYGGAQEKAYDFKDKITDIKSYRLGNRFGDNAQMMIVKMVVIEKPEQAKEKPSKK